MGRVNHFVGEGTAERYARGRPYFHPVVIRKISKALTFGEPVSVALDVACGTGKSSVALTEIASQVIGVDSSAEMLARTPSHERIEYVEAAAENLPFDTDSFDLVTVASAFHWFDRARFLSEARRVLRASGWLVIYDNYFLGKMKENTAYEHWHRNCYLNHYPIPTRDRRLLTNEEAQSHGFSFAGCEKYTNDVRFSVEELACYLETQSNVIAATAEGAESLEDVHEWLVDSLTKLFTEQAAMFEFGGHIWYLETTEALLS